MQGWQRKKTENNLFVGYRRTYALPATPRLIFRLWSIMVIGTSTASTMALSASSTLITITIVIVVLVLFERIRTMLRLLITIPHRILEHLERIVPVTARGGTGFTNTLLFRFDFLDLNSNFNKLVNWCVIIIIITSVVQVETHFSFVKFFVKQFICSAFSLGSFVLFNLLRQMAFTTVPSANYYF